MNIKVRRQNVVTICCCSVAHSCPTLCNPMDCNTPGFPVLHHLPELAQTLVHWGGDGTQPFHSLSPLFLLPVIFPSIRIFSNESVLFIRWPKYCSFSISPSNEISGLMSFRIDWFDVLTVQGTLKGLLQHQSLKASIFQCSTFFMGQLSNPYRTTGKTSSQDVGRWIEKWIIARWVNIWCWKLILLVLVWGRCVTSTRWRSLDCKVSWFYTAYKMKIWVLIADCYLGDL